MCCFVVAMVPLYDLFCEITGLNGKTGGPYTFDPASTEPDKSRLVKVNFITNTNGGMVWEFWPEKGGVRVHPGELKEVNFYVKNTTDKVMMGQAIPSLVPITATQYFHKTECFCFTQQVLQANESREMPVYYFIQPDLPNHIKEMTLSYTFYQDEKGTEALASAITMDSTEE